MISERTDPEKNTATEPKYKFTVAPGSVHEEFLQSSEDEVLMAGGRGSGKSQVLLYDALRYCKYPAFRGLILRRTMPELQELIGRAQEIVPLIYPGAKFREKKKYIFPSGAQIHFGYCQQLPEDVEQYRGQEYQWLGIDELTQWPTDEIITRMQGSLRTTDPSIPVHVRATTNPDGVGRQWVKERFIDEVPGPGRTAIYEFETSQGKIHLSRKWLHSTVYDNPHILNNDPRYVAYLMSLKGRQRDVWLNGSWDAADGMAFDEFDRKIHVCKPFEIPSNWPRFAAIDWGYGAQSLAVCLWVAVDNEGRYWVYREFTANGDVPVEKKLTAPRFVEKINQIEREADDRVLYTVVDGQTHQDHGQSGPTIFEQMKAVGNRRWKFAKKAKNSRKAGKQIIHELLAIDPELETPRLRMFNTCTNLIKELSSLPLSEKDPEDVDTTAPDHSYDSLRYALTSRPHQSFRADPWTAPRPTQKKPIKYF